MTNIFSKTVFCFSFFLVYEILLKVSEGKPWKDALLEVLPQRKFKTGKRKRSKSESSEESEVIYDENSVEENDINDETVIKTE